jgi:NADH-quinone oxidoreductase subunit G
VDSELSGNMIDLCPVGALTSKPFRYSARTWELSRRKSVSPHDSTGANLIVQVKNHKVMRVVPLENEDVNECWIADRDRFSYEALNSDERLTSPCSSRAASGRSRLADRAGIRRQRPQAIKASTAPRPSARWLPHSTVEELHLLAKLVRGLGSDNIDHRLRHADFTAGAGALAGHADRRAVELDRVLVVGSFLRKDHPLFAQRIRQAVAAAPRSSPERAHDDWAMPLARAVAAPSAWPRRWPMWPGRGRPRAWRLRRPHWCRRGRGHGPALLSGERKAVLLGNAAAQHPQAATLLALANWIAEQTGATVAT